MLRSSNPGHLSGERKGARGSLGAAIRRGRAALTLAFPVPRMEKPVPHQDPLRRRLRFDDFQLARFPDGSCEARVRTEWTGEQSFQGQARGAQTLEGEIRAAAAATLQAVSEAAGNTLELSLRGAKAIRAFDTWLVVVSVRARTEEDSLRLLGAHPCPDGDTARGAVLAALDAINRVVEPYLPEENKASDE